MNVGMKQQQGEEIRTAKSQGGDPERKVENLKFSLCF